MELSSMLCGSVARRGVWERMNTCICMAESLSCSSEIITTLLIGYTPIQNKKINQLTLYGILRYSSFFTYFSSVAVLVGIEDFL